MANSLKVAAAMRRRLKEVGIERSPALSLLYSTPACATGAGDDVFHDQLLQSYRAEEEEIEGSEVKKVSKAA